VKERPRSTSIYRLEVITSDEFMLRTKKWTIWSMFEQVLGESKRTRVRVRRERRRENERKKEKEQSKWMNRVGSLFI